jgi:hypothetical protein
MQFFYSTTTVMNYPAIINKDNAALRKIFPTGFCPLREKLMKRVKN